MGRYCKKCGATLMEEAKFCGKCGAEIRTSVSEQLSDSDNGNNQIEQRKNKTLSPTKIIAVVIGFFVVIVGLILAFHPNGSTDSPSENSGKERTNASSKAQVVSDFGNSKGLVALDEVEQKLNEAYIKVWEGLDIDFNGVTEFEIENGDEDTHDQTFSCFVMPSADGVTGLRVMGLVKDGQVIQMQSIYVGSDDAFNQLDTDAQASFLALVTFPISIFKEDIDTVQEFGDFLCSMDVVNDSTFGAYNMRTVDGDIEYTYMGGIGNGIVMSLFNIRYLPAFSTGFFEDDDDDVIEDDDIDDNNSTQGEISNNPSTEQNELYDAKIDEYRQALTMGSDAFDTKYNYGNDYSSINALMVSYSYNYGGGIYYTIFDIDKNGTSELIFSDSNNIIDIYTIHNGTLIKLFEDCYFGERSRVHVISSGRLLREGSGGASSASCKMYHIDTSTGRLSAAVGAYYCDGKGPNSYMTGYTYMKEDEYYDMVNKWMEESLFEIFEWTLIAENPEPDWGWNDDWDTGDDEVVYSENGNIKLGSYSSTVADSWDFINLVELTSDNILIFNTRDFAGVATMNSSIGNFNITGDSPDDNGTKESFSGTIAIDGEYVILNITSSTESDISGKTVFKYESAYFFGFNSMYPDAFSSFTSTTLGSKYVSHAYLGTATSGMVNGMLVLPDDPYYREYDLYKVVQSDGVHYYALGLFMTERWTNSGLEFDSFVHVYECKIDSKQVTLNYITQFTHSW